MNPVRFIHTSDLQLGMRRWFLGDEQTRFDSARLDAVTALGMLATANRAEFIVAAGDVFEDNSLSERVIGRVLERFAELPVPVYLLPGNHDPLVADSIFWRAGDIDNVTVLGSTDPVTVREGVEVVGVPWRSKSPSGDLVAAALKPLAPFDGTRIMVAHGQPESYSGDQMAGLFDLEVVNQALADHRIDYLALGDTHSTMTIGSSGKVWFSGAPEVTDFAEPGGGGEFDSGNALVVTIADHEVTVDKHPVGTWTFQALSESLVSAEDVEAFLEKLRTWPNKDRTVIKYALSGTLNLTDTRALNDGIESVRHRFVNLYERERLMNLYVEPGDDEISDLQLGSVASASLAELLDDPDDATARDAVNLLFRLATEAAT